MDKLFYLPHKSWRTAYNEETERWIKLSNISYLRKYNGMFFIEMVGEKYSIRISEKEFEEIKIAIEREKE